MVLGRISEGFTGDLILLGTFETQILPNFKQLWISMALLDTHFMRLLKNLLIQNFLKLGKICVSKVHRKIRSLVKRLCMKAVMSNFITDLNLRSQSM